MGKYGKPRKTKFSEPSHTEKGSWCVLLSACIITLILSLLIINFLTPDVMPSFSGETYFQDIGASRQFIYMLTVSFVIIFIIIIGPVVLLSAKLKKWIKDNASNFKW